LKSLIRLEFNNPTAFSGYALNSRNNTEAL